MKLRKGIFCVIYRKEKRKILYLILKRKLHWKGWEFVKGGIDEKKNLIKEVKREVKEETGQNCFNIKKYKLKGKYRYLRKLKDRKGYDGQSWVLYSAQIKNKKVKLDKIEHSSYKWVNYGEALKMLTYPNQKKCLRIVDKTLKNGN